MHAYGLSRQRDQSFYPQLDHTQQFTRVSIRIKSLTFFSQNEALVSNLHFASCILFYFTLAMVINTAFYHVSRMLQPRGRFINAFSLCAQLI